MPCSGLILSDILAFISLDPYCFNVHVILITLKSSFYLSFNAVFRKIGRCGSSEVTLQLIHLNASCAYCMQSSRPVQWIQEAQLSQRDRAMLLAIEYFPKSLKIIQGHSKRHPW